MIYKWVYWIGNTGMHCVPFTSLCPTRRWLATYPPFPAGKSGSRLPHIQSSLSWACSRSDWFPVHYYNVMNNNTKGLCTTEMSALKRAGSSDLAVMQGSGYYQRDKTRWRNYIGPSERLSSKNELLSRGIHFLQAIAKEQIMFSHVRFLFCSIFPREQISLLNIVPPPCPVLKFRDLVRKWHHNWDDSTDIIFRLILSVFYFSLISSCVIHHLLWHLFFATQFQGQMICFHY